jgi:hypothetical protein
MRVKCGSCNADILWVKMPSGKAMPVDAKAKTMIVVDSSDPMRKLGTTVQAHESHFATCPNAAEHRRGR